MAVADGGQPSWRPANDTEEALALALAAGDHVRYFQLIAGAILYLPAFTADRATTQRFLTRDLLGRTYLPVFTSVEALTAAVGAADAYAVTGYDELRDKWPDPGLRLVLNPGQPIDAWVDVEAVAAAAAGNYPVRTVAELMAVGSDAAGPDTGERAAAPVDPPDDAALDRYLRALLAAEVLVPTRRPGVDPLSITDPDFPWRVAADSGPPTIDVFTSAAAMGPNPPPWTPAAFFAVVLAWPAGYRLRVDPGSPVGFALAADDVAGLLLWRDSPPDG